MPHADEHGSAARRLSNAWMLAGSRPLIGHQLRVAEIRHLVRPVSATVTSDGDYGILVPLNPGEHIRIGITLRTDATGALRAETAQFSDGTSAVNALHVWCSDSQCQDAFASFAELFLDRLDVDGLEQVLSECHQEFRRLIGAIVPTALPVAIGLMGELLVLRDVVAKDPFAIRSWAGPRGERHDFRLGNAAIEVKATQRAESKTAKVRITDWDQLEVPEAGYLYLHAIRLERCAGGAFTVMRLVNEILSHLDSNGVHMFEDLLETFSPTATKIPDEFSVLARSTYEVAAGFPRLVPSSLSLGRAPSGVSSVSYDLDLNQASDWEVPWDKALLDLVRGGR